MIGIIITLQIITIPTFNLNKQIDHFITTFYNLNTLPTYKYIHSKTTFMCPRSIVGVPSSQALPGFLNTAPPSEAVLVPAVLGALAVWIQNQTKNNKNHRWLECDFSILRRVLFYFSSIWLHVYAFAFKSMVHCGSAFKPGASEISYYCTPPVRVPAVIGGLAVWQPKNKKKTKTLKSLGWVNKVRSCFPGVNDD